MNFNFKFLKKPNVNHQRCNTDKCPNYWNITYKNADGYCKPCNNTRRLNANRKNK